MGYKCECGRYFLDPVPPECNKCHRKISGDSSQIIKPLTKLQLGGVIHKKIVLERLPLGEGHFVEFLSENDERDTGNLPKLRR